MVDVDGSSHLYQRTPSLSRLAWSGGWRPPRHSVCIHQINRVNSRNGFGHNDSWQHHKYWRVYYYYYYIIIIIIIIINKCKVCISRF